MLYTYFFVRVKVAQTLQSDYRKTQKAVSHRSQISAKVSKKNCKTMFDVRCQTPSSRFVITLNRRALATHETRAATAQHKFTNSRLRPES